MASRTSAGVGLIVTITILGVAWVATTITTIIFLSGKQRSEAEVIRLNEDLKDFVSNDERNSDTVRTIADAAKKDRKSVVSYLRANYENAMQRVTGAKGDRPEQLTAKLKAVLGDKETPLVQAVRERDAQVSDLTKRLEEADKARTTALADLTNEVDRIKSLEDTQKKTLAGVNQQLDSYKQELDTYRKGIEGYKTQIQADADKSKQTAADEQAKLNDNVRRLENDNLVLQNTVKRLNNEKNRDILKPQDEYALVDGTVVGTSPADNKAFISLGKKDHVVLGMTFVVYPSGTAIRPDASGRYPRGKAQLEVLDIGESSSTCRVVAESKGNPVVKGDNIANAIYDPKKIYRFVVFGNFDVEQTGQATPHGRDQIEAIVKNWGGQVTKDLTGDVDFLILGQRPVLPPEPGTGAPIEIVREYIRQQQVVEEYDRLFKQAEATSLPVLNENRLYTLTGRLAGLTQ
jgi:hypothetical protein